MFSLNYEIFEALMLICFGSSWPFAIIRSLRSKSTNGVSIVFLSLILLGYVFGIAYKQMNEPGAVIWLYLINSAMIFIEIILYFRYKNNSSACITDRNLLETLCPTVSMRE